MYPLATVRFIIISAKAGGKKSWHIWVMFQCCCVFGLLVCEAFNSQFSFYTPGCRPACTQSCTRISFGAEEVSPTRLTGTSMPQNQLFLTPSPESLACLRIWFREEVEKWSQLILIKVCLSHSFPFSFFGPLLLLLLFCCCYCYCCCCVVAVFAVVVAVVAFVAVVVVVDVVVVVTNICWDY